MKPALSVTRFWFVRALALFAFTLISTVTNSQTSSRTNLNQTGSELFSFDFGIAPTLIGGAPNWSGASAGFGINMSWRPARFAQRRGVIALNSAGYFSPFEGDAVCILPAEYDGSSYPCQPSPISPAALAFGVLAGIAFGPDGSAARFMVGPALISAKGQDNTIGLQSRADFALPITGAVSFTAWAQGMLHPLSTQNRTGRALLLGVGLRLR